MTDLSGRNSASLWFPAAVGIGLIVLAACDRAGGSGGRAPAVQPTPPQSSVEPKAAPAAQSGPPAPAVVVDLARDVRIRLVLVRSGTFHMGSYDGDNDEKPVHSVTIAAPFYLASTEVTQGQWKAVMGTNPSSNKGDDLPVENVSWNDCHQFIGKLNSMFATDAWRLPSEAEWEYACRAGTTTDWSSGSDVADLHDYASYLGGSEVGTCPVGTKRPNGWGLYDMDGNVWEWCEDLHSDDYEDAPADGSAWTGDSELQLRVCRGGSWLSLARELRSSYRGGSDARWRDDEHGFRVVRTVAR